jgi:DNA-binding CsgD family transcriptional regulator
MGERMGSDGNLTGTTWEVPPGRRFWSSFGRSQVPMCLVNRDRLVVARTDAACDLFGSSREESAGTDAGRQITDADPALGDKLWHELLGSNVLYAETVVAHPDGRLRRVSYAGHGTKIDGLWHALMVVLSVRLEPGGDQLVGADKVRAPHRSEATLTRREQDVIRLAAEGADSRQIAAELCMSQATVRTHVANAMANTDGHTRAQLVAIALAEEFVQ